MLGRQGRHARGRADGLAVMVPRDLLQSMGRRGDQRAADAIIIIGVDGDFVPTLTRNSMGQKDTAVQNDKVNQRFGHLGVLVVLAKIRSGSACTGIHLSNKKLNIYS